MFVCERFISLKNKFKNKIYDVYDSVQYTEIQKCICIYIFLIILFIAPTTTISTSWF